MCCSTRYCCLALTHSLSRNLDPLSRPPLCHPSTCSALCLPVASSFPSRSARTAPNVPVTFFVLRVCPGWVCSLCLFLFVVCVGRLCFVVSSCCVACFFFPLRFSACLAAVFLFFSVSCVAPFIFSVVVLLWHELAGYRLIVCVSCVSYCCCFFSTAPTKFCARVA